jgi:hypothetical protein
MYERIDACFSDVWIIGQVTGAAEAFAWLKAVIAPNPAKMFKRAETGFADLLAIIIDVKGFVEQTAFQDKIL